MEDVLRRNELGAVPSKVFLRIHNNNNNNNNANLKLKSAVIAMVHVPSVSTSSINSVSVTTMIFR